MLGDAQDFLRRLRSMLPRGWLGDVSPIGDAVLTALGTASQSTYQLINLVRSLSRLGTATDTFIDMFAYDFFGATFLRWPSESDDSFRSRLLKELFRPRGTRLALSSALQDITGRLPFIVEPARPIDTGGYTVGGVGYGVGGAYGNLILTHSCFVTAFRPQGHGIALIAGFGTGGPLAYGNASMFESAAGDSEIFAAVAAVLPVSYTAWLRITN